MCLSNSFPSEAFGTWLKTHCPGITSVPIGNIELPKSGFSNETILFRANTETSEGSSEQRFVLRIGGEGLPLYPVQTDAVASSVELQQRAMRELSQTGLPVAAILGWEPEPKLFGRPFFVMEFIEGRILADFPSYAAEGFFVDQLSPEERRCYIKNGLAALAKIHTLDWAKAGLGWLERPRPDGVSPMQSQLSLWRAYLSSVPDCRDHALLQNSMAWLESNLPSTESEPTLSWGDARMPNMIFAPDGGCLSIMDWEGVAILPPEVDLAWWLTADQFVHEQGAIARLPGELSPEEQVHYYEALFGRAMNDLPYYRVFAAFRTVALMVSTYDRLESKGLSGNSTDADNPYERALRKSLDGATKTSLLSSTSAQ